MSIFPLCVRVLVRVYLWAEFIFFLHKNKTINRESKRKDRKGERRWGRDQNMVPRVSAPPAGLITPRAEWRVRGSEVSAMGNPRAQAPLVHSFKEECVCVCLPSVYSSLGIWQVESYSLWPTALSDNPCSYHFRTGSGIEGNYEQSSCNVCLFWPAWVGSILGYHKCSWRKSFYVSELCCKIPHFGQIWHQCCIYALG